MWRWCRHNFCCNIVGTSRVRCGDHVIIPLERTSWWRNFFSGKGEPRMEHQRCILTVSVLLRVFTACPCMVRMWHNVNTLWQRKGNFLNIIKKSDKLRNISDIMSDVWATTTEIGEAAIKVFQILYGNKEGEPLYKIRYTL